MSSVSADSIATLIRAEAQHRASLATQRDHQETEITVAKMAENEQREAPKAEGIGELVDRKA